MYEQEMDEHLMQALLIGLNQMKDDTFAYEMERNQKRMPLPIKPVRRFHEEMEDYVVFHEGPQVYEEEEVPLTLEQRIQQALDARELRSIFSEIFMMRDPIEKKMLKEAIKSKYDELGGRNGRG
jgi:hypothetical protein